MLLELLPIYKDFKDTGYQIRFEQIECSLFNEKKKEFDNLLGTRYNILLWRVVRVVEGAALEMLCPQKGPRVRIPDSPPS